LLLKGAASAASTSTMDTASAVAVIVPHDCIYSIAVVWHLFLLLFKASNATILIKTKRHCSVCFRHDGEVHSIWQGREREAYR